MIDAAALAAWSKVPETDAAMAPVVTAVNSYVAGLPVVVNNDGRWRDTTMQGALMLGARLLRRRNSPNGVEALPGDIVSYTSRYDSDIARMLEIDGFEKPAIG